jgi:hypothetical protein
MRAMIARPISITVIAWWFILAGLLGVYFSATMESNPMAAQMAARSMVSLPIQEMYGVINGFVIAGCGIGFLKGFRWSRLTYLIWYALGLVFALLASPIWVPLGMCVFYAIILSFLCRRSANLWFEASEY